MSNSNKLNIKVSKFNNFEIIIIKGFGRSYGVDIDNKNNIYIPSFDKGLIFKISSNLKTFKTLDIDKKGLVETKKKFGHILKPHEISFDDKKNMYVTEMGYGNGNLAGRVTKLSKSGKLIKIIGLNQNNGRGLDGPTVSFFGKDNCLYVSEWRADKILRYNKKYELTGWLGKFDNNDKKYKKFYFGTRNNQNKLSYLNHPHALRFGPDNKIYVVDTNNHRIVKFNKNGKFLGWIGKRKNGSINKNWSKIGDSVKGDELGAFNGPLDLEIYKNFIYISDNDNHRVVKVGMSGKSIGWFGKNKFIKNNNYKWMTKGKSVRGKSVHDFFNPYGLRIKKNTMYVADRGNERIKIIKSNLIN